MVDRILRHLGLPTETPAPRPARAPPLLAGRPRRGPEPRAAETAVTEYGTTGGFDVTTLEGFKQESAKLDLSFLTPAYLSQFDGLMLMTNGNLPLTDEQKRAVIEFVRGGKALVGVHCASQTMYDYSEFGEVLGGYYRRSIVPTAIVGQKVGVLKVEDPSHPATKGMGASWDVAEEFYQFGTAVWDASGPTEQITRWDGCTSRWRSHATASTCCSASTRRRPTSAVSVPRW